MLLSLTWFQSVPHFFSPLALCYIYTSLWFSLFISCGERHNLHTYYMGLCGNEVKDWTAEGRVWLHAILYVGGHQLQCAACLMPLTFELLPDTHRDTHMRSRWHLLWCKSQAYQRVHLPSKPDFTIRQNRARRTAYAAYLHDILTSRGYCCAMF